MAIAIIAFSGFNNLGRPVTPIFLLIDHFFYHFSMFGENEENLSTRSLNFLQHAPLNSVLVSISFICYMFSNAS